VPDVGLDPALPAANQGLASLDALAAQAFALLPPSRDELPDLFRGEAGVLLDGLLARVARGSGALDVAIGEGFAALAVGDRAMQLAFSSIGDYAQERLGIAPGTAAAMERLARRLRDLPLLREAVRRGEVTARKATVVARVARGPDEERWVARARVETVRALQVAVRETARGAADADESADEPWDRVVVELCADERARVDEAMALAGRVLGAGAPKWQRLEAICQEFLGAHPIEPREDEEKPVGEEVVAWLESAKAFLEEETRQWAFIDSPALVATPETALEGERDPRVIDAELRRLAGLRDEWDEVLGHLALLMKWTGLWKDLQFASFSHYCAERLGMAAKTVGQRAWLSRRLYSLPGLREAMREGRVSYEKARLVASVADDASVAQWIARAEETTCVALRREIEAAEERQMCVRGELDLRVPRRVDRLLAAAFRAARDAEVDDARGVPVAHRGALHRDLEAGAEGAHDAVAEGDRARRRVVHRAGLQPAGGELPPRRVPFARRLRRPPEPDRDVPAASPRRRAHGLHPRARHRAGRARVGGRAEGAAGMSSHLARPRLTPRARAPPPPRSRAPPPRPARAPCRPRRWRRARAPPRARCSARRRTRAPRSGPMGRSARSRRRGR
jgi:hypothetical protein